MSPRLTLSLGEARVCVPVRSGSDTLIDFLSSRPPVRAVGHFHLVTFLKSSEGMFFVQEEKSLLASLFKMYSV